MHSTLVVAADAVCSLMKKGSCDWSATNWGKDCYIGVTDESRSWTERRCHKDYPSSSAYITHNWQESMIDRREKHAIPTTLRVQLILGWCFSVVPLDSTWHANKGKKNAITYTPFDGLWQDGMFTESLWILSQSFLPCLQPFCSHLLNQCDNDILIIHSSCEFVNSGRLFVVSSLQALESLVVFPDQCDVPTVCVCLGAHVECLYILVGT